jgi:EpsI family protein
MSVSRLAILQLILIAGLGSAYLIPSHTETQPAGVNMSLPESVGQWTGVTQEIGLRERQELASDTSFARDLYSNAFDDHILVSIVLAGEDPDNSIHRPERCLPAQGWTVLDSETVTIEDKRFPGNRLKLTRLHNQRKFQDEKGNIRTVYSVNYYWFVGYRELTSSHIQRALIDIRDRVSKGVNQRWAYVTLASTITEGLTKYGRSEKATDLMIQSFIAELFPKIVNASASAPAP